jgi:hypothetical protein
VSDDRPLIQVHPEPTDEEAAAIAAAVALLHSRRAGPLCPAEPVKPPRSKWIAAARREAIRGLDNDNTR